MIYCKAQLRKLHKGTVLTRGEQNVTGADLTDQRRRHYLDSSAYQLSQGRRLEGEAHSDANAV